jgi:hypothetical protein
LTPDQPISLAVAVFCSILCWTLPVRAAIVPLCVAMCAYPTVVNVPPPQLQMTVARVVGLALMARCLFTAEIRERFQWAFVDTCAAIYFALLLIAQLMTTEPVAAINNRGGFFLSALLPYFCVRMLVVDRPSLYIFLKGFLWTALPLAALAVYQNRTGTSPFIVIMQNAKPEYWVPIFGQWHEIRPFLGIPMFRASAPFMQCIMFGWFFAIQIPWATNLFWERRKLMPWLLPWFVLPIGTIATVSAGPMMMAAMSFMITALFPLRKWWKFIFGAAGGAYALVSLFAKRGVMEIVASFGLDPASSFYRVNLLHFTLGHIVSYRNHAFDPMANHWIAGYGTIPPAYDDYHDLCIQWICLVVQHGILGTFGFYLFLTACAACMWKAKKRAASVADEWLVWSMMSILIATLLAMQLVALFGEMFFLYHVFLGLVANTMVICGSEQDSRTIGVLAELDGRKVLLRYKLKPGQRLAIVRPGTPGVTQ